MAPLETMKQVNLDLSLGQVFPLHHPGLREPGTAGVWPRCAGALWADYHALMKQDFRLGHFEDRG
jgi:hypothetical protein